MTLSQLALEIESFRIHGKTPGLVSKQMAVLDASAMDLSTKHCRIKQEVVI